VEVTSSQNRTTEDREPLPDHCFIVVVEDNDADFEAFEMLLRETGVSTDLVRCRTGQEAVDLIHGRAWSKDDRPLHILLDINLPGVNGLEVLRHLRANNTLAAVPVTMLTLSANPRDVESCYRAGANSYLAKPSDLGRFTSMVNSFVAFWLKSAVLPDPHGSR
jgi:CheY-like chemotaxis protein